MPVKPSMAKRLGGLADLETRIVYAWERPSIMRKHIYTGAMGTVYWHLFFGIYLVTFGNRLGLHYWQWGTLAALSSLALTLQMASAWLVGRITSRRTLWFLAALAARLLRASAVTVGFWLSSDMPGTARALFLALLVISNSFEAIAAPPWWSWLADIIPHEEHGTFWGRRSAWIAAGLLAVLLPIGWAVDLVPEGNKTAALMGVFALAFALGLLDLFIHKTIPEPPKLVPPRKTFRQEVLTPLHDPSFRPWLLFNACWTFGMTLGGSMVTLYCADNLGMQHNLAGASFVLIILPQIGIVLLGGRLGRMVDDYGVRRMLRWGHLGWALLPLFWLFAGPQTALWWVGAGAAIGGVSSAAAINAATKLTTRLPPPGHVPMYVAVSTCVGNLSAGLGALTAGLLLQLLKDVSWSLGGRTVIAFHLLFLASLLMRFGSTLLIGRIHEPPSRPVGLAREEGRS